MEVRFTAEQEARLSRIASHNGIQATELVKDAARGHELYRITAFIRRDNPERLGTWPRPFTTVAKASSTYRTEDAWEPSPAPRELVFTPLPYIVVYRVTETAIEILRIWHGAQTRH